MSKTKRLHVGSFRFNPPPEPYPDLDLKTVLRCNPYLEYQYRAVGFGNTFEEALENLFEKIRISGFVVDRKTRSRITNALSYGGWETSCRLPSAKPQEDELATAIGTLLVAMVEQPEDVPTPQVLYSISIAWNALEDEKQFTRPQGAKRLFGGFPIAKWLRKATDWLAWPIRALLNISKLSWNT